MILRMQIFQGRRAHSVDREFIGAELKLSLPEFAERYLTPMLGQLAKAVIEEPPLPADGPPAKKCVAFYLWKFLHNAVVHPLMAFPWPEPRWLNRFHDWTAKRCWGAG